MGFGISLSDLDPTNWSVGGVKPFKPFWKYDAWKNLFGKGGGDPEMPAPPAPGPDLTDQAVRDAQRKKLNSMFSSRTQSFLTGPLGDRSQVPLMTKSILGE